MSVTLLCVPGQYLVRIEGESGPAGDEILHSAARPLQRYRIAGRVPRDQVPKTALALCFMDSFSKLSQQIPKSQTIKSMSTASNPSQAMTDSSEKPPILDQQMAKMAIKENDAISTLLAQLPSESDLARDPCHQISEDGKYPPGEHAGWWDENFIYMIDGKNMPNYDPYQEDDVYKDSGAEEDTDPLMEGGKGSSSQVKEAGGSAALPHLYERLDIPKKRDNGVLYSLHYDDDDDSQITRTYFIPQQQHHPSHLPTRSLY